MSNLKELFEELSGKLKAGDRIGRHYSTDYKLIPTGIPGDVSDPTKLDNGTTLPKGYRMVRAKAVTFDRAASSIGITAPQVGSGDNDQEDKGKEIFKKYSKRYQRENYSTDSEVLSEGKDIIKNPPYILTLKRITTRNFGDVQVGLYFNDQLKKYFSIPFPTTINNIKSKGKGSKSLELTSESISGEEDNQEFNIIHTFLEVFNNLSDKNKIKFLNEFSESTFPKFKKFILENNYE